MVFKNIAVKNVEKKSKKPYQQKYYQQYYKQHHKSKKICGFCKKEFMSNRYFQKYCCGKCRQKYRIKYKKIYAKIHPRQYTYNTRMRHILHHRFLKALKNNIKSISILKLLGCTIEELWAHLEKQFKPGMTRENHGKWHIDHIKPCCSFDLSDTEQQKQCFHYTNLQPLWAEENLRKGKKFIATSN